MGLIDRTARLAGGVSREIRSSSRALAEGRLTYATDILASRALAVTGSVPGKDDVRSVTTRSGVHVNYRRNRGDIQGVREVFLDDHYRLPSEIRPTTVLDLGANIGLVSCLYASRYDVKHLTCVEPVPGNLDMLRLNLRANGIRAEVVAAAVAPTAGVGRFEVTPASNLGHLDPTGSMSVPLVTMAEVVDSMPARIDLLKIDIEGGEGALLLDTDLGWLERVGAVIAEIHPEVVDYDRIVKTFDGQGFRHIPPATLWETSMTMFVRY